MPQITLFSKEFSPAARQQKTDRLILSRLLDAESKDLRLQDEMAAAHPLIVKWAELESSGRLLKLKETQLQGDFLSQIFGQVLGYSQPTDNAAVWHQEQHRVIAGQTPDAVLGRFSAGEPAPPLAVVELKGPKNHPDRDRSNGRTAVDQCWDYLNNTPPACRWGIVSNLVSFRLYERDSTKRAYEHFTLQSLRNFDEFRRFYTIFHRQGLVEGRYQDLPRALRLLKATNDRQRVVSDELYENYSKQRFSLIEQLCKQGHPTDLAIEMAQRLFDRVIFIAFCEDRQLLPEKTLRRAGDVSGGFHAVTNPRWQSFKNLFRIIDGTVTQPGIPKYNGGLFAVHPVDDLNLPDEPWTNFFVQLSHYDFRDEVNLDVLGHLFERSITELEKIKQTGLFEGADEKRQAYSAMPQSVKRKQFGTYYTPPELTGRIVQYTVEELIVERFAAAAPQFGGDVEQARRGVFPEAAQYWQRCLEILQALKIIDPACGSGAFLFQAYNVLEQRYIEVLGHLASAGVADVNQLASEVPHWILQQNLYGVDLSPEAVEIAQLALWIRSATHGQTLATLTRNIIRGNSLVHDAQQAAFGFDWRQQFPEVFDREQAGFDCVIGNPPWERIKLQEREFFSLPAPPIATATNAAKRRQLVAQLESADPALFLRYQQALSDAESLLDYCRKSQEYPLTGRGDINLYAVFAELAYRIVAPRGRVGLLTPSGIASDMTTKDFFAALAESDRLIRLYDFENRTKDFFPDVDGRFKFCIINFGGAEQVAEAADYAFFIHRVEELDVKQRHIPLSGKDIKLMNPNTRTCPIFRTRRDAKITKSIYQRVPVLIDHSRSGPTGNAWGIKFRTMFHQTNDAELFREAAALEAQKFKLVGNRWVKGKQTYLPLYEAKMVQAYDHRAADVITDEANWVRQGQTEKASLVKWQNPEQLAMPRYWIDSCEVDKNATLARTHFLVFKDVTSPTNQRTMIAAQIPYVGVFNSAPLSLTSQHERAECCLLGNWNSIILDFVVRQKISNLHLNYFIVEQIPTLPPDTYSKPCPWQKKTKLEKWISERVLKLTCTAEDMLPLADACNFTGGSFKREYGGRLNKWDEAERATLLAELDAAYFHLYGIQRDDAVYILSTFKGIDQRTSLLADSQSTTQRILGFYDQFAAIAADAH